MLEGQAETIWDASGITATSPVTAQISLLNDELVGQHDGLSDGKVERTNSEVIVENVVVQQTGDGGARVTATVKRLWDETAATGAVTSSTRSSDEPGEIDPDEATISIFVFDRCGGLTIIEAPIPAEQDPTDLHDGGTCSSIPGTSRVAAADDCDGGLVKGGPCRVTDKSLYGPDGLQCEVDQQLGKKGWYFRTAVSSDWMYHAGQDGLDDEELWIVENFRNTVQLYPGKNAKQGWGSTFATAFDKAAHVAYIASACYTATRLSFEVAGMVAIAPGSFGDSSLGGGLAATTSASQDCKEYFPSPGGKTGNHKLSDSMLVTGRCPTGALDFCTIRHFRHQLDSEAYWDFKAWETMPNGQKINKRYKSPTIRHTVWITAKRDWRNPGGNPLNLNFQLASSVGRYQYSNCITPGLD
ncbi:hypothetical protein [Nonomuraea bangladeshensis]|uniref:hypothetical protein n=1 Tax=Nonomuraea bangladeshensis TaxID=404385 RepID=UPI0031E34796